MIKRILAIGSIAALGAGIAFLPSFEVVASLAPNAKSMNVQAGALRLICPGAAMNTGGNSGTAVGNFSRIGAATISKAGSQSASSTEVGGARLLTAEANSAQGSTAMNATQLQNANSARLNGLLGASCQAPSTEQLLLGGDTSTGRETLLLLSNPSSVPATVNLEVFAEGGQVQASGLSGIAVSANSTNVVPLSSIIPETRSFAVKVSSRGAAIGAWLQQRTVRGLLYAGADFVSPVTEQAVSLSIPGVLIRGSKDSAELIAINDDYADTKPALRIFNPGDGQVTFTAQIFGASAKTFGTVIRETVAAHSTKDFDINGLADGDYVAFIKADKNIAAAIRLPRNDKTKKPNTDFTWLQAGSLLSGEQQIAAPAAGITKLSIANPNSSAVTVKVNSTSVSIAANSVSVIKVSGIVRLDSGQSKIAANLVVDVSGAVTNLALVDYRNTGSQVKVRTR